MDIEEASDYGTAMAFSYVGVIEALVKLCDRDATLVVGSGCRDHLPRFEGIAIAVREDPDIDPLSWYVEAKGRKVGSIGC